MLWPARSYRGLRGEAACRAEGDCRADRPGLESGAGADVAGALKVSARINYPKLPKLGKHSLATGRGACQVDPRTNPYAPGAGARPPLLAGRDDLVATATIALARARERLNANGMSLEFKPNLEKIVELLLRLAHVRPNADKYQAVKFFYLADKEHLTRYGRPITSDTYYALDYGPVASNAMDLLEHDPATLRKAGIEDLPFRTEIGPRNILYIREPYRDVDESLFSKSDMKVFNEIIDRYGKLTFAELYNITHSHFAYNRAWRSRWPGSRRAAMRYEDMIDDEARRQEILEDIGPVASHIR
jgi:uncharacterized phage-associated protein